MTDTEEGLREVIRQLSAENLSLKESLTTQHNDIVDGLISHLKSIKYVRR